MKQVSLTGGVAVAVLALVIGACSQSRLSSDLTNDLATFMEVGKVYDAPALEQALVEATIGTTPSKAIVPLVFTMDGKLLSAEQTLFVFDGVSRATSEVEAAAFLEDTGVSLYFTTLEVYTSAIARLMKHKRGPQDGFYSVNNEKIIALTLPTHESAAFVFLPYATTGLSSDNLKPTQDPDCMLRCSRRCSVLRVPALVIVCFGACVALFC